MNSNTKKLRHEYLTEDNLSHFTQVDPEFPRKITFYADALLDAVRHGQVTGHLMARFEMNRHEMQLFRDFAKKHGFPGYAKDAYVSPQVVSDAKEEKRKEAFGQWYGVRRAQLQREFNKGPSMREPNMPHVFAWGSDPSEARNNVPVYHKSIGNLDYQNVHRRDLDLIGLPEDVPCGPSSRVNQMPKTWCPNCNAAISMLPESQVRDISCEYDGTHVWTEIINGEHVPRNDRKRRVRPKVYARTMKSADSTLGF